MSMLKIGVLLPRSSLYPMMGVDLLNAIKAGLRECGQDEVQFCTDNIGFGGDEKEVYARAEKMLLEQDPQLVVAFVDDIVAAAIQPLFEGYQKLLLVINPGANIPDPAIASPFRFSITLQAALGSRLTAMKSVAQGAKKFIISTSFYEGGYLSCYSLVRGMDLAGGSVYYNDVVPFRLETYNAQALRQATETIHPDAILAQFSAEGGDVYLREFAAAGLTTPLYVSPFVLEEEWLGKQSALLPNMTGYVPWSKLLPNNINHKFTSKIQDSTGRAATVFHLLGWEAALFAARFGQLLQVSAMDVRSAATALVNERFETPRGMLMAESETGHFFAPMYFAEAAANAAGQYELKLSDTFEPGEETLQSFVRDHPQGVVSRWKNTYLCI